MSQQYSFPIGLTAQWHDGHAFEVANAHLRDWLFNTGSLTERLQANCKKFDVTVIGQHIALATSSAPQDVRLHLDEQNALPNADNGLWQIREVVLHGDGVPWVFARSILPNELCQKQWANLGNQPLGQRIFNDDSFKRSKFEVSRLDQHPLTREDNLMLWARRSKFSIEQHHLLVAEVFLPDCPCYDVRGIQ